MAKLYFKYGAMGSSKSAQALITKFNYEEKGMSVWLIKPGTDTRDGADIIQSRIGLRQTARIIYPDDDIIEEYHRAGNYDVIIADEAQFLTPEQIDGQIPCPLHQTPHDADHGEIRGEREGDTDHGEDHREDVLSPVPARLSQDPCDRGRISGRFRLFVHKQTSLRFCSLTNGSLR